jgi:hypothetical protein
MAEIFKFPKQRRSPIDAKLIDLLVRALVLSNNFLSTAVGRQTFAINPEEGDVVLDLIEANTILIAEARRK